MLGLLHSLNNSKFKVQNDREMTNSTAYIMDKLDHKTADPINLLVFL